MTANFSNPGLRAALEAFKKEQAQNFANHNEGKDELNKKDALLKVSHALLNTRVLVPAKWDKEPVPDPTGAVRFEPDTKIQLMVLTNNKTGKKFFPFFTSMEEVEKLYQEGNADCLVLEMKQYLPFLQRSKGEVEGIVLDAASLNGVFPTSFIEGIYKAGGKALSQGVIRSGAKVLIKNVTPDCQDLEAELISSGFHEPAIRAIYLKERVDSPAVEATDNQPAKPEESHWFVIIDSDEIDTGIFTRIGQKCKDAAKGKNIEFIFTDQKLGQDIAKTSKPIYTRYQA